MSETYSFKVSAETLDAIKALNAVANAAKQTAKDQQEAAKNSSQAWGTFKGVLGAEAFIGAFHALTDAAKELFQTFVVEGVKAAEEADTAFNNLTSALKVAGDYSEAAVEDFQAFAEALAASTTASADQTIKLLALAKSFGATNEGAKLMVQAATELAAVTGDDLDTAFQKVSNTLSGSAGKLDRLNPKIRELTEDQLKAGEAARVIVDVYGGSAVAKLDTYGGSVTNASKAFAELQQEIGNTVVKNPAVVSVIQDLQRVFADLQNYVADNSDTIKTFVSQAVAVMTEALKASFTAAKTLFEFYRDNQDTIKAVTAGLVAGTAAVAAYGLASTAAATGVSILTAATVALEVATGPVGLAFLGVGVAVAAAVKYFDEIVIAYYSTVDATMSLLSSMGLATDGMIESAVAARKEVAALEEAKAAKEAKAEADKLAADASEESADRQSKAVEKVAVDTKKNFVKTLSVNKQFKEDMLKLQTESDAKLTELELLKYTEEQIAADQRFALLVAQLGKEDAAKAYSKELALQGERQTTEVKQEQAKLKIEIEKQTYDVLLENQRRANNGLISLEQERQLRLKKQREEELAAKKKAADDDLTYFMDHELQKKVWENSNNSQRLDAYRGFFSNLSQLSRDGNKQLGEIGKAAAIAGATIDTYRAATAAYAAMAGIPGVGPALGAAAAAAAIVAGLANVRAITSQRYETGGIVPGSSFNGDNVIARVNSGELILNRAQQSNIAQQLTGTDNSAVVTEIRLLRQDVRALQLTIGDEEVFNAVNR